MMLWFTLSFVSFFLATASIAVEVVEIPCSERELACDGGGCIEKGRWCNSVEDCDDGSDERFCASVKNPSPGCNLHHYECNSGTCIPINAACDKYYDCVDGSDETIEACVTVGKRSTSDLHWNTMNAVRNAELWILSQRNKDYGWNDDTARAVIALWLTNASSYEGSNEGNLIKKQLNIEISASILKNATKEMSLGKLASSVNALLATCQDPVSFQGLNLVRELRIRTDNRMQIKNATIATLAFLTLCLTGQSSQHDYQWLQNDMKRIKDHQQMDLEAMTLLAMSCFKHDPSKLQFFAEELAAKYKSAFLSNKRSGLPKETKQGNVYTTALVLQALEATGYENWAKLSAIESLINYQKDDGSFGDMLATYHSVLALTGKSLQLLKNISCHIENYGSREVLLSGQAQKNVDYSLWFGNPTTRTHTIKMKVDKNWTVFEVMKYAAEKNEFFQFHYEETPTGISVYSIATLPNDAERNFQWFTLRKKPTHSEQPIDLLSIPEDNDEIIMWYKDSKK